ncbi:MAG TPA: DUF4350 domain-containing protein, partial [Streptosporangiaceae bacterium]
PAALVAIILLGGVVIALLQPASPVTRPLDPRNVGGDGTHALAALLAGQGKRVTIAGTAAAALAQAGQAHGAVVVTDPGLLTGGSLARLAAGQADLLIVAPGRSALRALAPGVTLAGLAPVASHRPGCGWPGGQLAGPADTGGELLTSAVRGAWRCYPAAPIPSPRVAPGTGYASLVRYASRGRIISVLGTGTPLTNGHLGADGNAALALNLLAPDSRVAWLLPSPVIVPAGRSVPSLIPGPMYLVLAELAIAAVLAALWRMRRFGPLVAEPLPVVVRASETVEGHGRLYRSRRARGRAAAALRAATVARITARTGLPAGTAPEAVSQELAGRTGRTASEIQDMLFGPDPGDDGGLVRLAADLDTLEGQVLTQ